MSEREGELQMAWVVNQQRKRML